MQLVSAECGVGLQQYHTVKKFAEPKIGEPHRLECENKAEHVEHTLSRTSL